MILLFSRDLIHNPLKTMESLPCASTGCASARLAVPLHNTHLRHENITKASQERVDGHASTQPQAQVCAGSPAHPRVSVRHKDHDSPLWAALILKRLQLSHIKPRPSVNCSPVGYPKEHLSGPSPAQPSAVGHGKQWLCALLGTEWLGASPRSTTGI